MLSSQEQHSDSYLILVQTSSRHSIVGYSAAMDATTHIIHSKQNTLYWNGSL